MGLSHPIMRDKEDHSPQTIAWHLAHHRERVVLANSIHRHPGAADYVIAAPLPLRAVRHRPSPRHRAYCLGRLP
jgi:hypothetical protein